jgi:hypothetical protein
LQKSYLRQHNQPLQTDRGDKLRLPRLLNGKPVRPTAFGL